MAKKSGRAKGKKSKRGSNQKAIDRAFLAAGGGRATSKKGRKGRPAPTAKAKKAYYGLLVKSYKRLRPIMKKYHPEVIRSEG